MKDRRSERICDLCVSGKSGQEGAFFAAFVPEFPKQLFARLETTGEREAASDPDGEKGR